MGDIIVLSVLAVSVILAAHSIAKSRKSGCCGNCAGCRGCSGSRTDCNTK